MMKPDFITFTGFDDRTNISEMERLSKIYPIEWGILISPTNKDARYPSKQAIEEVSQVGLNLSLHCCGGYAKNIQKQNYDNFPLKTFMPFRRIQVNGKIYDLENLAKAAYILNSDIIIQERSKFSKDLPDRVFQLYDTSGGRGELPEEIIPYPGFLVGYAGGISPFTVEKYLSAIGATRGQRYWIDMETGVRTNGWFDLKKVETVCKIVYGIPKEDKKVYCKDCVYLEGASMWTPTTHLECKRDIRKVDEAIKPQYYTYSDIDDNENNDCPHFKEASCWTKFWRTV